MKICIDLPSHHALILKALAKLHGWDTPAEALLYLAACAHDGVVRPGSWERQVVDMAFPMGSPEATRIWAECAQEAEKAEQRLNEDLDELGECIKAGKRPREPRWVDEV